MPLCQAAAPAARAAGRVMVAAAEASRGPPRSAEARASLMGAPRSSGLSGRTASGGAAADWRRASSRGTTNRRMTARRTVLLSASRCTTPYLGVTATGPSGGPGSSRRPATAAASSRRRALSPPRIAHASVRQASAAWAASSRAIAATARRAASRAGPSAPVSLPDACSEATASAADRVSSMHPSWRTAAASSAIPSGDVPCGTGSGPGAFACPPLRRDATVRDCCACRTSSAAAAEMSSRISGGAPPTSITSRRCRAKDATEAYSPRAACSQSSTAFSSSLPYQCEPSEALSRRPVQLYSSSPPRAGRTDSPVV
mmetsp:Transcript_29071/g.69459  ORF Transcript_29071/g.69459 Transcript_29071/m.69459 type:complete len:315 (+) Transcript_29071:421-1365(+)